MANYLKTVPTGYVPFDITLGQNIRDLNGNLLEVKRGWEFGKQYNQSGIQGSGKSTFLADCAAFGIRCGYPLTKILVENSDNAEYGTHRLSKITGLHPDIVDEKFEIHTNNVIEDFVDKLDKEHKKYMEAKHKAVPVVNVYDGSKAMMMPYMIVIVDTITSMVARDNTIDGKQGVVANQDSMIAFKKLSSVMNVITNYCDGNIIVLWSSHLKKNQPDMNQQVAAKEYKSSAGNFKSHVPRRLREVASSAFWMTPIDGGNLESSKHPINKYALQDIKSGSVYAVDMVAVKSRTGSEGRTKITMMFVDGKFDRQISLLTSCYELGVFKETSGKYPSGDDVSIFKERNAEYELGVMGQKKKNTLELKGYDYKTNIIEARLLLCYTGDDEVIQERKQQLNLALFQQLEEKLYYELENNNVTDEELNTNKKQLNDIFSALRQVKREATVDRNIKVTLPPKQTLEINGEYVIPDDSRDSNQLAC